MQKKIFILIIVIGLFILLSTRDSPVFVDQIKSEKMHGWEGIGTISLGFESSSFRPIEYKEKWWVTFASDSLSEIYYKYAGEPISSSPDDPIKFYEPVTFHVLGDVSKSGHYGHRNSYSRKITIKKISEPPKILIK